MLVKIGIIPFLLYNLSKFTSSIGVSITPTQLPFTNTLELLDKYSASTFNMMVKAKAKDWTRLKTGFEKCYSSGVHQMEAIRTIISFEKAKMNLL